MVFVIKEEFVGLIPIGSKRKNDPNAALRLFQQIVCQYDSQERPFVAELRPGQEVTVIGNFTPCQIDSPLGLVVIRLEDCHFETSVAKE
jgi:hypothetical protein